MDQVAPPTRTPRTAWIDAGLGMLAAGGPGAVRIEPLAEALGVSRGGFYWHFAGRAALLEEMLDVWERQSIDEVLERVDAADSDPRARVRLAGALTFSDRLLPIDLAVRDWARRDATVAERLRRVDNQRMHHLRRWFGAFVADDDEIEARAMLAFSLLIGNHLMSAEHDGRTRADVVEAATRYLLK